MSGMRGLERVAADRRHIIAAQVRCSTGFTQLPVRGAAGPVRPRPEAADAAAQAARDSGEAVVRNGRFARWLVAPCMALGLWVLPALGAPPAPGSEDHRVLSPHADWIHSLRRGGVSCCDMSDGRPVEARIVGGVWQVRFRPGSLAGAPVGWVPVEDAAVLRVANPVGAPVAFWAGGRVLCFVPGVLF